MNYPRLIFPFLLAWSSVCQAEDSYGRKANALSLYKAAYVDLERVRSQIMTTDGGGFLAQLKENNDKLYEWIFTYKRDVSSILKELRDGGSYPDFSRKLDLTIARSAQDLSNNSSLFLSKKKTIVDLINSVPRKVVPYEVPGFASQQGRFEVLRSAILDSVLDGLAVNEKVFSDLISLQDDFATIFRQKVRETLIARGIEAIDDKMKDIDNVLKRPVLVASYLKSVYSAQSLFTRGYLTLDYEKMKDGLEKLAEACSRYNSFISSDPELNGHAQSEQLVISRACSNAPKDFAQVVNELYNGNLQTMFADSVEYYKKPVVERYCKQENRGKYNCGTFAWAGTLSHADILALSSKELAVYTDVWKSIMNGSEAQ